MAVLFVANGGSDAADGSQAAPFASIQHAVTMAKVNDGIKVAAGTYGYSASADAEGGYTTTLGTSAVVTVAGKLVTIQGGYTTANWDTSDPAANPTVIDGADQYRGILVEKILPGGGLLQAVGITGFTVTRGLARGIPARGGADAIDAFGGGMLVESSPVDVRDVTFSRNRAVGTDTTQGAGGAGAGGAVALRAPARDPGTFQPVFSSSFQNVVFDGNTAQGGSGATRGGLGQGGGLFSTQYRIYTSNTSLANNRALGGGTAGGGSDGGTLADAEGGGAAFLDRSFGWLDYNTHVSGNQAVGGAAPNGDAGGAYGGGVYVGQSSLGVYDSDVRNNLAVGGNGHNAGSPAAGAALGGGVMSRSSVSGIERSFVVGNMARGGTGTAFKGVGGGGGVAFVNADGVSSNEAIVNSVVAGNTAALGGGTDGSRGGGGGGVLIDGGRLNVTSTTLADNRLSGGDPAHPTQQGQAVRVGPTPATTLDLSYSIIADHANTLNAGNGAAAALSVQPGGTANLKLNLFADNGTDSNSGDDPSTRGTYNGGTSSLSAASAGFVSPGTPNFDYRLSPGSPAVHAATGSVQPVDITNQRRRQPPALGAFELRTYVANDYESDGRTDLALYDPGRGSWLVKLSSSVVSLDFYFGSADDHDVPAPGDYNGIGKTLPAVYRPSAGVWFFDHPDGSTTYLAYGSPADHDIPVPGDYNGDGRTDLAVYRPSAGVWFIRNPDGSTHYLQFGSPADHDIPAPGDYDGTGTTQLAVYRPSAGVWFIRNADGSTRTIQFGSPADGDLPVPGDYFGTGKTTEGVFRPPTSQWFGRKADGSTFGPVVFRGYGGNVPAVPVQDPGVLMGGVTKSERVSLAPSGDFAQVAASPTTAAVTAQTLSPSVTRVTADRRAVLPISLVGRASRAAWLSALDGLASERMFGLWSGTGGSSGQP